MGSFVRNNRATVVCGVIVALVLGGLFAWSRMSRGVGSRLVALVHDGDGVVHELPLGTDATLEVSTSLGHNTIVVENCAVRMAEADCPTQSCTRQAPMTEPGRQIICLPHKLWIEVVPAGSDGGEMDVTLAEDIGEMDVVAR